MAKRPKAANSLAFARERRNLSRSAVANEIGTSVARLERFEAGELHPSARQISHLARIYGVPDYQLYSQDDFDLEPLLLDFRKEHLAPLETSPKGLAAYFDRLDTANTISMIATKVGVGPELKLNQQLNSDGLLSAIPLLYSVMEFDPGDPQLIRDPDHTLRKLRYLVERFGVFSFLVQVPPSDYRGLFAKTSHDWGMSLINKRTFKSKARIFTLMHEFGHFLTNLSGVSDPLRPANDAEKLCNEFTSHFLSPKEQFDELVDAAFSRHNSFDDRISFISGRCLLSKGATAYRLRGEDRISLREYKEWMALVRLPTEYGAEDPPDDLESAEGGGRWAYNVISDIGYRSIEIVKKGIENQVIDEVDAGRILNARGETLPEVFKTVEKRLEEIGS